MDNELFNSIIEKAVAGAILHNSEFIETELANGLDYGDGWEKVLARAVCNAVKVSTRLSFQMVIEFLIQDGVLEIHEDALQPNLRLIQRGENLDHPEK